MARVAEQSARAYTTAGGGMKSIREGHGVEGHVVEEFKLGNTRVKICDDYYVNRSDTDVDAILYRIAQRAQQQLSAQQDT